MAVKLGIIGYKNHAERLLNILDKKKDCHVEFIYHPTKKLKDVRGTNKILDLLSCDGILISSPNDTHFSYLKKLEKFNGYIFCEKPPVILISELNSLKKFKTEKKQKIFFNFNFRYKKINSLFEEIIKDKHLGKIINVNIISTHGLAFKKEYKKSWRSKGNLHSVLDTVTVHFIDMLNLHFGKPKKIQYYTKLVAKTGIAYDTVNVDITYENGINAQILNSYASPSVNEISILTSNSWIVFRKNEFIIYHPRDTFDKKGFFKDPPIYKKLKIKKDEDYNKSLRYSLDNFVFHIKNNTPFDLKFFNTSLETNKIIIDLKNK
jgi:predicted dehydrogenase